MEGKVLRNETMAAFFSKEEYQEEAMEQAEIHIYIGIE